MPKDNLTPEEKSAQLRFKAAWEAWSAYMMLLKKLHGRIVKANPAITGAKRPS